MIYLAGASLSFLISYGSAWLVKIFATKLQLVDNPEIEPIRRQHKKPIPLGGGIAIAISLILCIIFFWYEGSLVQEFITSKQLIGFLIALLILLIGGTLDDKFGLPVLAKICLPILAATTVVSSGIGVNFITNPLGGVIRLDELKFLLISWNGVPYYFTVWADLLTIGWLTTLMYTTKLLDGLDGLVTGITIIGAVILFFLSLTAVVLQFDTALLLVILAGSFAGFLPHNWNPAHIFLGDSGSLIAGFTLGVIAIIAGGKIATTVLVLGLPAIDAICVVGYRAFWQGRSPFSADRQHFHFRLLDAGFSVKQVVLLFYIVAIAFGSSAIFLETTGKIFTLIMLFITSILAIVFVNYLTKHETD
jgi:UDP-GlcNAc:undecaprenyl-phosphate GlcNAc-1-phosphate transferase